METNNREYTLELLQNSTGKVISHKVVQEGYKIKSYSFDVSKTSILVPQSGGKFKVTVTSTFLDNEGNNNHVGFTLGPVTGATYNISGNDVIFTIPANTQNSDKKPFSVVLTQNNSKIIRTINFSKQKPDTPNDLVITGFPARTSFNSDPINISYGVTAVYANGDRRDVVSYTTESLSISDGSCNRGTLVINENTTDNDRNIVVSISFRGITKKITLLQKKTEWVFEVSPTNITLGSKESATFTVTSTKNGVYYSDWRIKNIRELPSWLNTPHEVSKSGGTSTQAISIKD